MNVSEFQVLPRSVRRTTPLIYRGQSTVTIVYPGADGSFFQYEDDGKSFNYRKGEWMGTKMAWDDVRRILTLTLAEGSRMLPSSGRQLEIKLQQRSQKVHFDGRPLEVKF